MIEHDRKKLLKVINLIKDIGTTTDDKCPITYNQVCELQNAEYILRGIGSFAKPKSNEHGHTLYWEDYEYAEDVMDNDEE
jgi:hypothetical protein